MSAHHNLSAHKSASSGNKATDGARLVWSQLKTRLKSQFKGQLLDSVLNAVSLEKHQPNQKGHIILTTPTAFHQRFLKSRISQIQRQTKQPPIKVQFSLEKKDTALPVCPPESAVPNLLIKKNRVKKRIFNPDWTFCSFIQGSNNVFAFSLAKSIAQKPFKNTSNPVFIYGPSGMGKTHLLHAIGNDLSKQHPQVKTLYLSAERFFNDCISHIRKNQMSVFREKYRKNIQVLLLDDIPILGRGESTQEEFFHTYESLKQVGCQIVLTSDQLPKNIKGLKTRIRTRFEGGVVADIQAPDTDTKRAIIKAKSDHKRIKISEDIVSYIANMPLSSVRELEGHLNKIKMFCELRGQNLSLDMFKKIFAEQLVDSPVLNQKNNSLSYRQGREGEAKLDQIKAIQKAVCAHFKLPVADLKSCCRQKQVVQARNMAIFLVRQNLSICFSDMGAFFGGRNHSTLLHSVKSMKKKLTTDKLTFQALEKIKKSLR